MNPPPNKNKHEPKSKQNILEIYSHNHMSLVSWPSQTHPAVSASILFFLLQTYAFRFKYDCCLDQEGVDVLSPLNTMVLPGSSKQSLRVTLKPLTDQSQPTFCRCATSSHFLIILSTDSLPPSAPKHVIFTTKFGPLLLCLPSDSN